MPVTSAEFHGWTAPQVSCMNLAVSENRIVTCTQLPAGGSMNVWPHELLHLFMPTTASSQKVGETTSAGRVAVFAQAGHASASLVSARMFTFTRSLPSPVGLVAAQKVMPFAPVRLYATLT